MNLKTMEIHAINDSIDALLTEIERLKAIRSCLRASAFDLDDQIEGLEREVEELWFSLKELKRV